MLLRLFLLLLGMPSLFQECLAQSSIYMDCGEGNKEYELPVYAKIEIWDEMKIYYFETIIEAVGNDSMLCAEYRNRTNTKIIAINQIRKITFLKNPPSTGSGLAILLLSGAALLSIPVSTVNPVFGATIMLGGLSAFLIATPKHGEHTFYLKNCQITLSPD